jgi:glycosyltransferase involved in cell wall biosynthesis
MKISIITINFNNRGGLEKTMASVFRQGYTDFEYIIIDGGSSDGSVELIAKSSNKLAYWISEQDNGVYHAMNKGIRQSKGEYLFFLNSGDEFASDDVLENLTHNKFDEDIVYGDLLLDANGKTSIVTYPKKLTFRYWLDATICHQVVFIKRTCFEIVGLYDERLKIMSDWKFFIIGFARYNFSYRHINLVVAKFYEGGISGNSQTLLNEKQLILNAEFNAFLDDYDYTKQLERRLHRLGYLNPLNFINILLRKLKM